MVKVQPLVSRQDFLWWLNADFRIPFSRREDDHFVQKLIDACDEVLAIPGLVGYVAEELRGTKVEDVTVLRDLAGPGSDRVHVRR